MFQTIKGWFRSKKSLIKQVIEQNLLVRGLEESVRLLQDNKEGIVANHLFLLKCMILQYEGDVLISPEIQNLAGQDESEPWMDHAKDGSLVLKLKEVDEYEPEMDFEEDE